MTRRWRIVIHGGIDGFSRKIMFLKASTDNKASTVFSAFLGAVQKHGLPVRTRTDKGESMQRKHGHPFSYTISIDLNMMRHRLIRYSILWKGGENRDIARYMLEHPDRGPGRPVIYVCQEETTSIFYFLLWMNATLYTWCWSLKIIENRRSTSSKCHQMLGNEHVDQLLFCHMIWGECFGTVDVLFHEKALCIVFQEGEVHIFSLY